MKKFAVLLTLLFALNSYAAPPVYTYHVITVGPPWADTLEGSAAAGTTIKAGCLGIPYITVGTLGTFSVPNFHGYQCVGNIGVVSVTSSLPLLDLQTTAVLRDSYGNFNYIAIPAISGSIAIGPVYIPGGGVFDYGETFDLAESTDTVATYIALVATDTPSWVTITSADGTVGEWVLASTSGTWYQIHSKFPLQKLYVMNGIRGFGTLGSGATSPVYALAFKARRENGAPILLPSALTVSTSVP